MHKDMPMCPKQPKTQCHTKIHILNYMFSMLIRHRKFNGEIHVTLICRRSRKTTLYKTYKHLLYVIKMVIFFVERSHRAANIPHHSRLLLSWSLYSSSKYSLRLYNLCLIIFFQEHKKLTHLQRCSNESKYQPILT